ncbi:MAG: hypothetical protein IPL46_02735 [Saprospiraceae bacterium]|nr:hypothetical protein [Saprospiraceae bacterium]
MFVFSAWRAIETDAENIQTHGVKRSSAGRHIDSASPKGHYRQTTAQIKQINASERHELFSFNQDLRKLELRREGRGFSDLLLFAEFEDIIPGQNLRLLPPDRIEKSFYKSPIVISSLLKNSSSVSCEDLTIYPSKIDIPVSDRITSHKGNRHKINPGDLRSLNKLSQLANDASLSGIEDCYYARTLQCGQIVSGTNIYQDTSLTSLRDCNNNLFYGYRGVVWHHLIGTGDQMMVKGSSTGDNAEMHVYYGSCDTLYCIGGVYSIQGGEKVITTSTVPGRHYYVMLANYNTPLPNMNYQLKIECCSNSPLFYSPPNNFDSTYVLITKTNNTITATNVIGKGASITYSGALGVNLNAGFEVATQAVFQADVIGCPVSTTLVSTTDDQNNPSPVSPAGFLNKTIGQLIKEEPTVLLDQKQVVLKN